MNAFTVRRFEDRDAQETAALIAHTLRTVNIRDYPAERIEKDVEALAAPRLIERAAWMHMYVVCDGEKVIGCGAIGPYWGSETQSSLFNIFVHPGYQGRGAGRQIIETLEADEFFLRAGRIEIPASVTACGFYRRMGYDYKDGVNRVDEHGLYRLEKFRS